MNSSITEELFFTGLIGNVSIDSIIPYILKMETAEYNSQDSDSTEWRSSQQLSVKSWVIIFSGTLFNSGGLLCWTAIQNSAEAACFWIMHGAKLIENVW